ncbi:hypothetical protein GQ42DRAFT_153557 [Ramicandelaber brevisporus]|nr:hypothetical protein GQ42DRAFT_153557 [Ramicandelaber brevisporus]
MDIVRDLSAKIAKLAGGDLSSNAVIDEILTRPNSLSAIYDVLCRDLPGMYSIINRHLAEERAVANTRHTTTSGKGRQQKEAQQRAHRLNSQLPTLSPDAKQLCYNLTRLVSTSLDSDQIPPSVIHLLWSLADACTAAALGVPFPSPPETSPSASAWASTSTASGNASDLFEVLNKMPTAAVYSKLLVSLYQSQRSTDHSELLTLLLPSTPLWNIDSHKLPVGKLSIRTAAQLWILDTLCTELGTASSLMASLIELYFGRMAADDVLRSTSENHPSENTGCNILNLVSTSECNASTQSSVSGHHRAWHSLFASGLCLLVDSSSSLSSASEPQFMSQYVSLIRCFCDSLLVQLESNSSPPCLQSVINALSSTLSAVIHSPWSHSLSVDGIQSLDAYTFAQYVIAALGPMTYPQQSDTPHTSRPIHLLLSCAVLLRSIAQLLAGEHTQPSFEPSSMSIVLMVLSGIIELVQNEFLTSSSIPASSTHTVDIERLSAIGTVTGNIATNLTAVSPKVLQHQVTESAAGLLEIALMHLGQQNVTGVISSLLLTEIAPVENNGTHVPTLRSTALRLGANGNYSNPASEVYGPVHRLFHVLGRHHPHSLTSALKISFESFNDPSRTTVLLYASLAWAQLLHNPERASLITELPLSAWLKLIGTATSAGSSSLNRWLAWNILALSWSMPYTQVVGIHHYDIPAVCRAIIESIDSTSASMETWNLANSVVARLSCSSASSFNNVVNLCVDTLVSPHVQPLPVSISSMTSSVLSTSESATLNDEKRQQVGDLIVDNRRRTVFRYPRQGAFNSGGLVRSSTALTNGTAYTSRSESSGIGDAAEKLATLSMRFAASVLERIVHISTENSRLEVHSTVLATISNRLLSLPARTLPASLVDTKDVNAWIHWHGGQLKDREPAIVLSLNEPLRRLFFALFKARPLPKNPCNGFDPDSATLLLASATDPSLLASPVFDHRSSHLVLRWITAALISHWLSVDAHSIDCHSPLQAIKRAPLTSAESSTAVSVSPGDLLALTIAVWTSSATSPNDILHLTAARIPALMARVEPRTAARLLKRLLWAAQDVLDDRGCPMFDVVPSQTESMVSFMVDMLRDSSTLLPADRELFKEAWLPQKVNSS